MALEILVIIPPKPGKEERVAELVKWTTEEAKKNEPETSMYHAYSTTGDEQGTTDYIVHLRVNDETALAKRQEMKHHQYIAEAIGKEDLLRRPMRYMKLKEVVVWDR